MFLKLKKKQGFPSERVEGEKTAGRFAAVVCTLFN